MAMAVSDTRVARVLLLALCMGLAGSLAAQTPRAVSEKPVYSIAPGDGLQLFVWREAELTRDVTVRLDGKISVPLLGDVQAGGRTPEQLANEIATGLKRFLAAPQVTVSVREANASRFFVMGHVTRPGVYPLAGRTTVLQALALAGGLAEFAKSDRIMLIREDQGADNMVIVNYKKLEAGTEVAQNNVLLRPGDTILVP
jgi:polysaccharide export outer membrane protein